MRQHLEKLCDENEAFYFSDQEYKDRYIIRSFTYRLASWTDFQEPYAKESRGTAYIYDKVTKEWSLFARAYKKFFNIGEGIDKEHYISQGEPRVSYEKLDGSLILVGEVDGILLAKSKTSVNSEQALMAQEILDTTEDISRFCFEAIHEGFTPVFELIGRKNRIVLNYDCDAELVLLGCVNNQTGEIRTDFEVPFRSAEKYNLSWEELLHIQETGTHSIEGYVTETQCGDLVKIKLRSYVELHHLKDSVNNMKSLVVLVLGDNLDDLIGSFSDDAEAMRLIAETQNLIGHNFNHLVEVLLGYREKFFGEFKENRKEFALKYSKEPMFGSTMRLLNSKNPEKDAEVLVKDYISKQTKTQSSAEAYVNKLKG